MGFWVNHNDGTGSLHVVKTGHGSSQDPIGRPRLDPCCGDCKGPGMAGQTRDRLAPATLTSAQFLESIGLPGHDLHSLPDSQKRLPDGCHYGLEIPSTEGPRCLQAVLEAGAHFDVPVHRVSQGSGVFLLTDAELDEMVALAAAAMVEVSLFARPNAAWDASAMARTPGGAV